MRLRKKRTSTWIAGPIVGLMLLAVAGCSSPNGAAVSGSSTTMRIGGTESSSSIPGQAIDRFAELVLKYSNGEIQPTVYPGSTLGTFGEMATGMKSGTVQALFIQPDAIGSQILTAQVDAWPFMFEDSDAMVEAWSGSGGQKIIDDIQAESGYQLLAPTFNTPRVVIVNQSVTDLAGAKGMKIRVPGQDVYLNQMGLLGLSPTSLAITEVFTGMQQGVVDGMEGTLADLDAYSLGDVAKTVIMTNHVIAPKTFILWGEWMQDLSPANRDAVTRAGEEASVFFGELIQDQVEGIKQKFMDKGVAFVEPGMSFEQLKQLTAPMASQLPELAQAANILQGASQ